MAAAISAYENATKPATIAANKKDKATADQHALLLLHQVVKIDVDTIVPTPMQENL